jgi:hypothetical protein
MDIKRNSIGDNKLYKIEFKDSNYTILPYYILKRFDLITQLVDNCKDSKDSKEGICTLQLHSIDLNSFSNIVNNSICVSVSNIKKLQYELTPTESEAYNYLMTDQTVNITINKFSQDILYILTTFFDIHSYEKIINNASFQCGSVNNGYLEIMYNKFPILKSLEVGTKIIDYTYDVKEKRFKFEIYVIDDELRTRNRSIVDTTIIEVFKGFFKPMNCDVCILYCDHDKAPDYTNSNIYIYIFVL